MAGRRRRDRAARRPRAAPSPRRARPRSAPRALSAWLSIAGTDHDRVEIRHRLRGPVVAKSTHGRRGRARFGPYRRGMSIHTAAAGLFTGAGIAAPGPGALVELAAAGAVALVAVDAVLNRADPDTPAREAIG